MDSTKCLPRLGGDSSFELGLECREIAKTIKTRKIKYFGHIKRHTSFLKDVLEGKIEGSRIRGRQRRQWVDDIAEWTGKGIRQCTVEAQDREKLRSVSCQPLEQGRLRE
ncbi:endonuclease-reverse transcriptase [Elysia marginata]|uniref:Endonuclease-reverse transcriptase n=1 Tax=Elysia marginata TaxID=1093978 RepID=A0AAV4HBI5_9GAST|nr:endonuclease-reverse transcriptase [Elysia marginata]